MPEQLRQVVERIDLIQFTCVNQAHEEIAHPSPVHRLVKECVLSVKNRFLQGTFDYVVVQWCAGLSQEQRQLRPVPLQI